MRRASLRSYFQGHCRRGGGGRKKGGGGKEGERTEEEGEVEERGREGAVERGEQCNRCTEIML